MRSSTILVALCLTSTAAACAKSTVPMRLGDSTVYQMVEMKRIETQVHQPDGGSHLLNTLLVQYYSKEIDPVRVRDEAVHVGGYLAPVADSLGCTALLLKPSWPVVVMHLQIRMTTREMQVVRRGEEDWVVTKAW